MGLRLIAITIARSSAPLSTTAWPRSNSCSLTGCASSTGRRTISDTRSASQYRARCRSTLPIGRWSILGKPADPNDPEIRAGAGLIRPLEAAARKAGVEILLEYRMTAIHREAPRRGRVLGIAVDHKGTVRNIRARKAVVVATGGSTGNINFRRMFDPRLTEEYCGLAGMPWSLR